jgi:octaprenyl-diphosphate synthase
VNGAQTKPIAVSPAAADLLGEEMAAVERRLRLTIESREPRLTEISLYLIGAGGKRIRPMVAMAVFRACGGGEVRDMVDVAVALELIHSATLLHDDIIDGGEIRRGKASAYVKYGPADTLVTGDFLFSKAFELCGRFEEQIVRWAAEACIALTEGEIMQARFRRRVEVSIEDYREIIWRKTACLFQQGARVAAHLAGGSLRVCDTLATCGREIGMAFQVIDDLLDVEGHAARTGKPVGIDLRDGNPSLPIVLALPKSAALRRTWKSASPGPADIEEGLAEIRASGVLDAVRAEAFARADGARKALASLPDSPYRDSLDFLIAELRDRVV